MDISEYAKIKITDIPTEFTENITHKPSLTTDGYILILSEGAMTYPRVVNEPKMYCAHASTIPSILRLQQPQDYGNTPGVQSNFSL